MNQGYIINAFTNAEHEDNAKMAYALACTIKQHDSDRGICVMVDKFTSMPTKYESVFDYIVELPFGVHDQYQIDANAELWQMYHCTPFDETMYISCNAVVLNEIDDMWDNMAMYEMYMPSRTINFRHEINIKDKSFQIHTANEIDSVYTDVMFFSKSKMCSEFFKMLDISSKNWRSIYNDVLTERLPDKFDINILINATISMVGINVKTITSDMVTYTYNDLNSIEAYDEYPDSWLQALSVWFRHGKSLSVGNFVQSGVFVYKDQKFITEDILNDITANYKNDQNS